MVCQVWLTESLYSLCTASLQNRSLCCSSGLLADIVATLRCCQRDRLQRASADHLLRLLEALGQHSLTAAELKLLLQLLQQQQLEEEEERSEFPYKSQIIHIISSIARGDGFQHSRQYFDIQGAGPENCLPHFMWIVDVIFLSRKKFAEYLVPDLQTTGCPAN